MNPTHKNTGEFSGLAHTNEPGLGKTMFPTNERAELHVTHSNTGCYSQQYAVFLGPEGCMYT